MRETTDSLSSMRSEDRARLEAGLLKRRRAGRAADTIPPRAIRSPCALSFAQERLWFVDRFLQGSPAYNIPMASHLRGRFEIAALERAIGTLVARHESLRTTFATVDGEPVQVIAPSLEVPVVVEATAGDAACGRDAAIEHWLKDVAGEPFDLERGPLLRVRVLRLADDEHVLAVVIHHVVSDGWSLGVLRREVSALYAAYVRGEQPLLPALPIQYADYAVWQRERLQGAVLERELGYWRERLAGLATLELPTDKVRPAVPSYRGGLERFELGVELTAGLQQSARREGVTLYMVLLAAFAVLLGRYSGHSDIALGSPVASRDRRELEGLIGFFVNTLVMRVDLSGEPTFRELLRRVREVALGAYEHQELPFEKLVTELAPERELSRNPLMQVMFALQNVPGSALALPGLEVEPLEVVRETAKFDLTLFLWETSRGLAGVLEYATDLFDAASIARMIERFRTLLEAIVDDPGQRIHELPMLAGADWRALAAWNHTDAALPAKETVIDWFERQVVATPDVAAVVSDDSALSYRDLDSRANRLANYLTQQGVAPDVRVGICLERSPDMLVGLLGVLKAGGAYLPLDPTYPADRLQYMIKDAGVRLLLTREHLRARLPVYDGAVVCLDTDHRAIDGCRESSPPRQTGPDQIAYVIYTSGSTGRPKGVAMTHSAMANLIAWQRGTLLGVPARTLQFAPLGFDVSFQECFGTWATGGTLVLIDDALRRNADSLLRHLCRHGVERLFLPFVALQSLAEAAERRSLPPLRDVVTAGEPLRITPAVRRFFLDLKGARLHNHYGPTESHVVTSEILPEDVSGWVELPPIGRPIANTRIYLLDAHEQLVPPGVPGELCIAGAALARGYLNHPDLTAERFFSLPARQLGHDGDGSIRLYRTGDLARWRPDGALDFLGRADDQVKLRGYRIELGEIEALLGEHELVRQATVTVVKGEEDSRLVAYVVPSTGRADLSSVLRTWLKEKLPDYMVPSHFVVLDRLPLAPSGKVDRRGLPPPPSVRHDVGDVPVPPRDAVELHLVKIWESVLETEPISVTDNFFALGGHSLLAVRLMDRIRKVFGAQLPLDTFWYHGGTVQGLAKILRKDASTVEWPTLVELQPLGRKRPLFCVHTIGGNLFHYDHLARLLDPDRPVLGLQARGVYGQSPPHSRIEDIAADCVKTMCERQPDGPYLIAGFSSGGIVAYEVAQQLRAAGQTVGMLAFFDTFSPRFQGTRKLKRLLSRLLSGSGLRDLQEFLYHRVLTAVGRPDLRRLRAVGEAHRWAHLSYRPRPYPGDVEFFLAAESAARVADPTLGWGELVRGRVALHEVPGSHGLMVKPPAVHVLVAQLRACLDRIPE